MRTHINMVLTEFDAPVVKRVEEDRMCDEHVNESPWVEIFIGESIVLAGPVDVLQRWADDVQLKVRTA